MSVAIVIPARWASTRLPEKMLLSATGWPMVRHTYEQAKKAKLAQQVMIATDDERIAHAIRQFGGDVVMTDPNHPTGTDRLAEVTHKYLTNVDAVICVQGDEPELEPEKIDALIELFQNADADVSTLVTRFPKDKCFGHGSPQDPSCVKAVLGAPIYKTTSREVLGHQALYFSRSPVPYPRDDEGSIKNGADYFLHLGIYAYRPDFLKQYVKLSQGPLELKEKLEQLRVLENGFSIVAGIVENATPGIDTQADYEQFVQRWKARRQESELCATS